ncbi:flavin reductase family protein [Streptomyces coeruleorubidus]|uniref:flavin reductase family protein n=1 Tax=Streptomyces coeruleorubidus TaxID=116188 RepID=UPI00380FCF5A
MVSATEFRTVLARLPSGVTLVTARGDRGGARGLTVSAFCSVSLDPPLVLAGMARSERTLTAIHEAGRLGNQPSWRATSRGGKPVRYKWDRQVQWRMDGAPRGGHRGGRDGPHRRRNTAGVSRQDHASPRRLSPWRRLGAGRRGGAPS